MNTKKQLEAKILKLEAKIAKLEPKTTINCSYKIDAKEESYFGILNSDSIKRKKKAVLHKITESIHKYGIVRFMGKSLYDLESIWQVRRALVLIENGMVDNNDFFGDKVSKVINGLPYDLFTDKEYYEESDIPKHILAEKARNISSNQDEYNNMLFLFKDYYKDKLINKELTRRIDVTINMYGIEKYLGINLYEISADKMHLEARRAIPKMYKLKNDFGVIAYKSNPVEELSEYELDGILLNCGKKDFTDCTISESFKPKRLPAKQRSRKAA